MADRYEFRVVIYEHDGTWVALAADVGRLGYGDSRAAALADLRPMLTTFAESLDGADAVPVKRPVKTEDELRKLGELAVVTVSLKPTRRWPSWLSWLRVPS